MQIKALAAVEQVDQRQPDRRGKKAVERVQHGVPEGEFYIEVAQLAENFGGKNEEQHNDLQRGRDAHAEVGFHKGGDEEEHEREDAERGVGVVAVEELQHRDRDDDQAQHDVDCKGAFALADQPDELCAPG